MSRLTASLSVRVALPPVSAFALFLAIAAASLRRPAVSRSSRPSVPGSSLLRGLVTTAVAGYGVFLAIVFVFHLLIAGQRDVMRHAVAGGGLLAFGIAVPSFAILSRIEWGLRRRRSSRR